MEVSISKIWASPSTLHLSGVVTFKTRAHVQFVQIHVPLSEIPSEVAEQIVLSAGYDIEPRLNPAQVYTAEHDTAPLF